MCNQKLWPHALFPTEPSKDFYAFFFQPFKLFLLHQATFHSCKILHLTAANTSRKLKTF